MHYSLQQKIGEETDRLQWLILNHNLETFNSLYNYIKPKEDYNRSIQLIRDIKQINPNTITKSGIMLGLGEKENEVLGLFDDLTDAHCNILTIGQYLHLSPEHYPVMDYIHQSMFAFYKSETRKRGLKGIASSPFVRSSYRANELFREVLSLNQGKKKCLDRQVGQFLPHTSEAR